MRVPSPKESTERLRQLSIYTAAQLQADAETKALAAPLDEERKRMEQADVALSAAEDSQVAQMALRDNADRNADGAVRDCYLDVRQADGSAGGKAGPKQQAYFRGGLTGITLLSVPRQAGAMRVLAGQLAKDSDPAIAAHEAPISAAADALDAAVDAYEVAIQGVSVAYGQVFAARGDWIRVYEKTYGELVVLVGKRAAEKYFKVPKRLPKAPPVAG